MAVPAILCFSLTCCDFLAERPPGVIMMWLPTIVAVNCQGWPVLGLGLFSGFTAVAIWANLYHQKTKYNFSFSYWLNGASWVAYLAVAARISFIQVSKLKSPITLLNTTGHVLSVIIFYWCPLILWVARLTVAEEGAESKGFLYVDMFLSLFFVFMVVSGVLSGL